MFNYDIIKIETHPQLGLSVWFRDGSNGKIKFLPEYLTGVLQPLTEQRNFECAFIEDYVIRWPGELDVSPETIYFVIKHQQQVQGIMFIGQNSEALNINNQLAV